MSEQWIDRSGWSGSLMSDLFEELRDQIPDERYRVQVMKALRQLSDLKFALDESSIIAVTDQRGKIIYVNSRFCEISQYSREELIGSDHRIINSGYHDKAFMRNLWDTIRAGLVWRNDVRNKAKDGSYYWVNTTIVPFLLETGEPFQYLAVRHEVTKLKQTEEELQRMMVKVMQIQEEERKRISRELHDGIGQSMFSLLIQLDRLIARNGGSAEELGSLRQDVTFLMEDIRGLARELRPSALDDLGVLPAIRSYIEYYSEHYGIRVQLHGQLKDRLEMHVETAIYRIMQEALTNVGRYAQVSDVKLSLQDHGDHIEVRVQDEGIGFERHASKQGVGLFSMEERARAVGGQLTIRSAVNEGTEVIFTVPKRHESV